MTRASGTRCCKQLLSPFPYPLLTPLLSDSNPFLTTASGSPCVIFSDDVWLNTSSKVDSNSQLRAAGMHALCSFQTPIRTGPLNSLWSFLCGTQPSPACRFVSHEIIQVPLCLEAHCEKIVVKEYNRLMKLYIHYICTHNTVLLLV